MKTATRAILLAVMLIASFIAGDIMRSEYELSLNKAESNGWRQGWDAGFRMGRGNAAADFLGQMLYSDTINWGVIESIMDSMRRQHCEDTVVYWRRLRGLPLRITE